MLDLLSNHSAQRRKEYWSSNTNQRYPRSNKKKHSNGTKWSRYWLPSRTKDRSPRKQQISLIDSPNLLTPKKIKINKATILIIKWTNSPTTTVVVRRTKSPNVENPRFNLICRSLRIKNIIIILIAVAMGIT